MLQNWKKQIGVQKRNSKESCCRNMWIGAQFKITPFNISYIYCSQQGSGRCTRNEASHSAHWLNYTSVFNCSCTVKWSAIPFVSLNLITIWPQWPRHVVNISKKSNSQIIPRSIWDLQMKWPELLLLLQTKHLNPFLHALGCMTSVQQSANTFCLQHLAVLIAS